MKTKSFNSISKKQQAEFFTWLKDQKNNDPAYENMWADDWQDKPNTLPYILTFTQRYADNNGDFHIVYDGKKIVACGGICLSGFNRYIAIGGVRTWIAEDYRNRQIAREYLLPAHKAWAIEHGVKQLALSFNDYNKNIIKMWRRIRLGETRSSRQPYHMFYENFNELDYPVVIQGTRQWVIYEKLDINWHFNWGVIKAPIPKNQ